MSTYVEGTDMECPICDTGLIPMDVRNYETLSEHVGNPNGTPSEKVGFGCPDLDCLAFGFRWLYDGEGPYRARIPERFTHVKHLDRAHWHPKGTIHEEIHRRNPV